MSEFKVGDRVRIKKNDIVGCICEITILENRGFSLDVTYYEMKYIYSVISENRVYVNLKEEDLELIEKFKESTPIEELEQRIEKLEKCVMGEQNSLEKCENVSNFEKMTPKLGIKDFKDMIRPNKMVLNTNDPLEMIWNSTDEEEPKPSLLTEDERVILRNLDKKWKWIARDKDESLGIFNKEPFKDYDLWRNGRESYDFSSFKHLFQFIKWTDKEPYNIEELLKGECGNEN